MKKTIGNTIKYLNYYGLLPKYNDRLNGAGNYNQTKKGEEMPTRNVNLKFINGMDILSLWPWMRRQFWMKMEEGAEEGAEEELYLDWIKWELG